MNRNSLGRVKIIFVLFTYDVLSEHFYTSPYTLTDVLTCTSMLITKLYTNSQNIFLRRISFQRPRGLRTATASHCALVCALVYALVRPNRSVPTDPVLGLHSRSGRCWAFLSTIHIWQSSCTLIGSGSTIHIYVSTWIAFLCVGVSMSRNSEPSILSAGPLPIGIKEPSSS